jgi:hypothetical protein
VLARRRFAAELGEDLSEVLTINVLGNDLVAIIYLAVLVE